MNIRLWVTLTLSLITGLFATQCTRNDQQRMDQNMEANALVLSQDGTAFAKNSLSFLNTTDWQITKSETIRSSVESDMFIDPLGRVWISYWSLSGDNIDVYDLKGKKVATLQACEQARSGIQFSDKYAFVVCMEDGFSGSVSVLDLTELTFKKQLKIGSSGSYMLIASAINDKYLLISGLTDDGPDERSRYTVLTLVNTETLEIESQIGPLDDLDVWSILPYQDKFILLNVHSWRQTQSDREDILLLTPGIEPHIELLQLFPSPLWGALNGDILYTYHNPTWNQLNSDSTRTLGKLNLVTGESETWPLPDNWNADDFEVVDDDLVFAFWNPEDSSKDGLYRFDFEDKNLHQVMQIQNASEIIKIPGQQK